MPTRYDVAVVGGGPGGLEAALTLGRSRRRVLLCDAGPRRNAAATHVYNFVTRDGTPPDEFRAIARAELGSYPSVDIRDAQVDSIEGERDAFRIRTATGNAEARRVLLATGMVDQMLPIDGFRELWGQSIFQCPYCHGWEARDRRWGFLVLPGTPNHLLPFALMIRTWSSDITVFTNGAVELGDDTRAALAAAEIRIQTDPIARLSGTGRLEAVVLANKSSIACDVLFVQPPQRQVELVHKLGLALDDDGYVEVDPMRRETSIPGVFASGDLTSRMQAALQAAASGMHAAAMLNVDLAVAAAA